MVFLVEDGAVELDPFKAAQCLGLVAGQLGEHGDAQFFQLLLHFGVVVDHGRLDGQLAALVHDQLVVRCVVFPPEYHGAAGERALEAFHRAVLLRHAEHAHPVGNSQRIEQAGRVGGCQVHVFGRLGDYPHVVGQRFKLGLVEALGYDQVALARGGADQLAAVLVVVHGEFLRVLQIHLRRGLPIVLQVGVAEVAGQRGGRLRCLSLQGVVLGGAPVAFFILVARKCG